MNVDLHTLTNDNTLRVGLYTTSNIDKSQNYENADAV